MRETCTQARHAREDEEHTDHAARLYDTTYNTHMSTTVLLLDVGRLVDYTQIQSSPSVNQNDE